MQSILITYFFNDIQNSNNATRIEFGSWKFNVRF
ncbi:hypothetical protein AI2983V1_2194 [Enterobacter cloacae]|nr:hypothetical protein AI2983V1_2194 [Enterobacter cloacae]CAH5626189.1 hypothetical protein AI2983V1_2194 [Enterobacter cloacae]